MRLLDSRFKKVLLACIFLSGPVLSGWSDEPGWELDLTTGVPVCYRAGKREGGAEVVSLAGVGPTYDKESKAWSFRPSGPQAGQLRIASGKDPLGLSDESGEMTIAAWICVPPDYPQLRGKQSLVATMDNKGEGGWSFGVGSDGSLYFRFARSDKANTGRNTGAIFLPGKWHHIAVAWKTNQQDGLKFYVDGQPAALRQGNRVLKGKGTDLIPAGVPAILIGSSGGGFFPFSGLVRNIRIYDRMLDVQEVFKLSQKF